ncbi:MAG: hypothetical protein SP1CHLAM54_11200 [Chlamydiia bacterium]|nr:hypothetical protein [Chlamydiia bacterium]MCH9616023.1 hypothetical protein [Chlamydiia bacterium]MCH9629046.1 hypothetical protein [Chlamydiia bacterium]
MKRIVILGGGFGGVYSAMYLEKAFKHNKDVEIILVNKDNYFVYQPMLAEVVGGAVGILDTVSPIKRLCKKTKLYVREIEEISLENRSVKLAPIFSHTSTELSYDHLILALGNVTDFRDSSGLHEHALPFKNLADSLVIRNRVIDAVDAAANETEPHIRQQLLTFVIGGGGFSGSEVCAEVNDLAHTLAEEYPQISHEDIRVVMVHSKNRLMDREMPEPLGVYASELMEKRGVELLFGHRLVSATPEEAILDNGDRIPSKTIISSVPSSPNPLIEALDVPKTKGRVNTNPFMQLEGHDNIWALGDCAMVPVTKDDSFAPPTAQFAIRQAKQLASNMKCQFNNKPMKPFYFKALGMLGALGHHSAVAQLFGRFKFSGLLAWFLWRFIYWMKLPGSDRKLKVAVSWMLEMLIPQDIVQLKISPSQGIMQLHFEPGEIIFNEGDKGDYLYIITEGKVEIFNKKGYITHLGQGEFFGEMALLNEKSRGATVKCEEPTNVLALRKKDFGMLIANFKELREAFESTEKTRREEAQ